MTSLMQWPLAAALAAAPLLVWLFRRRALVPAAGYRCRLASIGFALGVAAGLVLAFAIVGGGFGDLRYWLDCVFLAAIALGAGLYVALLAYLGAGRTNRSAS
ncbi:MAG: hypothetical protein EHM59_12195 [Betaproteobacteria bacterium]|nr:MAG: hypothetical protein EHM59_12195 [Betaproteobacteria bacterium]